MSEGSCEGLKAKPGSLWLASLAGPRVVGGLGAYARLLGRELSGAGWDVCHLMTKAPASRLPDCEETIDVPIRTVERSHFGALVGKIGPRLASRPALHGGLQWMAERGIRNPGQEGRSNAPGAVHFIGTGWDFVGYGFLHAARSSGAVFTIIPAVHPGSWGDDVIDLRLYKQADAVFCLSDHEISHLAALGVPEVKLVKAVLPPMCRMDGDRERFRALHQLGDRPVVLFMGRRDEGKGYPSVLRAWVEVLRQFPSAVLCLAGPGGSEFTHLMSGLRADSFRDLGVPDEREKADALAGCDVFCLPSAHESFGIVYVEAWSYEKPVICGSAAASRELVEDGTGLWSDGTSESTASSIQSILRDPAGGAQMGARGRRKLTNSHNVNAMIATHSTTWRLPNGSANLSSDRTPQPGMD